MTFKNKIGAKISLDNIPSKNHLSMEELLFSESPARYILEISSENIGEVESILQLQEVPFAMVGQTVDEQIIDIENIESIKIDELFSEWKKV